MTVRFATQDQKRPAWLVFCLLVALVLAQPFAPAAADPTITGPGTAGNACPLPEVESARVVDGSPWLLRPGRILEVTLKDFDAWFACQTQSTSVLPTLYVDHSARPELPATANPLTRSLRFELTIDEKNRGWWAAFADASRRESAVAVGIGTSALEHSAVSETEIQDAPGSKSRREAFKGIVADRYSHIKGWSFVAVLVLVSLAMAWLTRLVRDRGPLAPGAGEWNRSFSLARTQLFLWTLTVFGVAGVVWIWTGVLPTLDVETLSLLGISAGTSAASKLIDGPQPAPVQAASRFFVADLLNDGTGASIHRFQAVLANVGLAAIFIGESLHKFDFYAIPPSWAALMLLSSGLYLGLKTQEPR
jgi:hypothetical protein